MPFALLRGLLPALTLVALLGAAGPAAAQTIDTRAREAIVVDATTGTVLFEKNADDPMPTASMSKVMTMYMVFQALEEGRLSLTDTLPVSEYAWRTGGSKMFVEVGTRVPVEDLIRGVVVQSGNDASIVLAEGLAGTEEAFARQMTEQARELGMTGSNFRNATGLPDPEHYSTARDLALLARRIYLDFPQYHGYWAEPEYTWNDIRQHNRNPLLGRVPGADGLKTGHTEEAGYGLIGTAERDGRRLIVVVGGLASERERAEDAERLLEWGFREFDSFALFGADEVVETAATWMGTPDRVPLVTGQDLAITLRRSARDQMRVVVRVDEPVPAPVEQGQPIATLLISAPDMPVREVPLLAGAAVEREGFFGRIGSAAGQLLFGD